MLTVAHALDRDADGRASQLARASPAIRCAGLRIRRAAEVLSTVFGDQMFAIIQQTGTVGIAAALLGLAPQPAGPSPAFAPSPSHPAAAERSHARPARFRRAGAR